VIVMYTFSLHIYIINGGKSMIILVHRPIYNQEFTPITADQILNDSLCCSKKYNRWLCRFI